MIALFRTSLALICVAQVLTAVSVTPASGDDKLDRKQSKQRVYLIGNSLTWDTSPSRLDGDVQWHVDCGKSLPFIFENPQKPCLKSSTLWPAALVKKQYDVVSLQVHYGSTLDEDVKVISRWVTMQPKAAFVIHSGWPRHETRAEEYALRQTDGTMKHSAAYMQALLKRLRREHKGRVFRETNSFQLLQRVADDIREKKAPFSKVEDLYRDKIHMKLDTGRYLMHNAMRRAIGQAFSTKGFEKLDPDTIAYLDTVLQSLDQN